MKQIEYNKPNGTVIEVADTAENAAVAKELGWEKAKAEPKPKAAPKPKAKAE